MISKEVIEDKEVKELIRMLRADVAKTLVKIARIKNQSIEDKKEKVKILKFCLKLDKEYAKELRKGDDDDEDKDDDGDEKSQQDPYGMDATFINEEGEEEDDKCTPPHCGGWG